MNYRLAYPLPASSYLEDAFVRWVLTPATSVGIVGQVTAQHPVAVDEHTYRLDYLIAGARLRIAVELDGFEFTATDMRSPTIGFARTISPVSA